MPRRSLSFSAISLLVLLAGSNRLHSQEGLGPPAGSVEGPVVESSDVPGGPGSDLTVYVMTMGPGEFVWERFGHNAIWIHDASLGTDIAYNWGLFSFEQEDFILRFLRGHMDYWMEGIDAEWTATHYIRTDRSIWVQELNLTRAQRIQLRDDLLRNEQPENRFYRYDYFRDNCSTRVRDAIDRVLGGALRAQTEGRSAGTTYRQRSEEAVGESPVLYTGIMLGIAGATDRELSVWEDMFMPLAMMEHLRGVTVPGPTGEPVPLVLAERQLYASTQLDPAAASGPSIVAYLGLGLLIAAAVVVTARAAGRRRDARIAFRFVSIFWGTVAGILGTVLLLLWVATDHLAAHGNENLFFFNPLLLGVAVLLPMAVTLRNRGGRAAFLLTLAVAAISLIGFLLNFLPWLEQRNGELIALALPVNLAFAYAAWHFHRGRTAFTAPGTASSSPARTKPLPNPA